MEEILSRLRRVERRRSCCVDCAVSSLRGHFLRHVRIRRDQNQLTCWLTWIRSIRGVRRAYPKRIKGGSERVTSVKTTPGWTATVTIEEPFACNLIIRQDRDREWIRTRNKKQSKRRREQETFCLIQLWRWHWQVWNEHKFQKERNLLCTWYQRS